MSEISTISMISIDTIAEKLSKNFPAWVTSGGNNLVRDKTVASMFYPLYLQMEELKKDMMISTTGAAIPSMVGIYNQPKVVTGIRFFFIQKDVLIKSDLSVREENRSHILKLTHGPNNVPIIQIDDGVTEQISETGLMRVYDNDSFIYYLLVDFDRLPVFDQEEEFKILPVYSLDYLEIMSYFYGLPQWVNENNEHFRTRLLTFAKFGMVSRSAIEGTCIDYASYYGYTFNIYEHREHWQSYCIVCQSFNSDYETRRTYIKDYSDNVQYIELVFKNVPDDKKSQLTNDIGYLVNRMIVQGTRYSIQFG